ncbi:uncharacterized protein LOC143570842 [Bidens hawaiensis]|uniref:uncharacterized protein LOC143570842 n=1 Tax=Bidens hawaiensis TaxID=980011 RepID=UPI00404A637A
MAEVQVIEALLFGDHEAKAAAAEAVPHLSNKQRHKLAENGAVPALVNKIRIAKSGAIPLLLNIIRSQIRPLIDHAIAALLILSSCTANKSPMAACGAIEALIETLVEHNSTQVKLDIIVTLHNLSPYIPTNLLPCTSSSLIHLINECEKSSKLVERSIGLLENIVSASEVALREIASTTFGIRALVERLRKAQSSVKNMRLGYC